MGELKEKLFKNNKSGWENVDEEKRSKIEDVSSKYMSFLNKAKTEREFIKRARELANSNGYKDIMEFESLKPGDKIYFVNREKSMYCGNNSILCPGFLFLLLLNSLPLILFLLGLFHIGNQFFGLYFIIRD